MPGEVGHVCFDTLGDRPKLVTEARQAITVRVAVEQRPPKLLFECRNNHVTFIDIAGLLREIRNGIEDKGKQLYDVYCWSCHGKTGYGDGAAGSALGQKPANFHDDKVRRQRQGSLFWKITHGRGNMPPFKDDQIIVRQSQNLHASAHLLTSYFRLLRRVQKPPWRSLGCHSHGVYASP